MKTTLKVVGAVLAGAVFWAVLWNIGMLVSMSAFPEDLQDGMPITNTGILLGFVTFSVLLSFGAGFITGWLGKVKAMLAVGILSALQMSLGLFFQISYWSLMPIWYHLSFLGLIIPITVWGGFTGARRSL